MTIKITTPNGGSDSLDFGCAQTPVVATVTGTEVSSGEGKLELKTTTGGTSATKATVLANGNVGIGVTNPDLKMEIVDTSSGASKDALLLTNYGAASNTETGIFFSPTEADGAIRGARISALNDGADDSNSVALKFSTGLGAPPVERMRITSAGNVGIGTTAPTELLEVGDASSSNNYIKVSSANNTASGIKFRSDSSKTTGWDIGYEGNGNYLFFKHDLLGTPTERFRIAQDGAATLPGTFTCNYLHLNAQNADAEGGEISLHGAASHPSVHLDNYAGNMRVHTLASGKVFQVHGGNGIIAAAFNTSSDYRLKENVEYKWDATSRLKQLKPARFNFIGEDNTVDGFMAHEAQEVVPESVTGFKDEVDDDDNPVMQGIDQAKLVPLLVKTIQELEARIAKLEENK